MTKEPRSRCRPGCCRTLAVIMKVQHTQEHCHTSRWSPLGPSVRTAAPTTPSRVPATSPLDIGLRSSRLPTAIASGVTETKR